MSFLKSVFSSGAKDILSGAEKILDKVITNDGEKSSAKKALTEVVLKSLNSIYSNQKEIIVKEISGNWLQRSWRPIIMLSFGFIVVYAYFIEPAFIQPEIPVSDTLNDNFWGLLKLGLGGYVMGRSAEKIVKTVTTNIDIPFLKKKDRKNIF